jgi:WhiB family transcriptional regulator, redox-sensing transcriptional regulator
MRSRRPTLKSLVMPRLKTAPQKTDWYDDAACRDADTTVFFPVSDAQAEEAKEICAICPVREACLEFAVETRQSDGVWGGLTPIERHRLIRRRQKAARKSRTAA